MLLLRNNVSNFLQLLSLLALLLTPFYVLSADNQSSANSSIEVFVNSSVVDKKYTLADIRAIFAMRKTRWNDGKRIQVFVLPDTSSMHRQFTKSKLKYVSSSVSQDLGPTYFFRDRKGTQRG